MRPREPRPAEFDAYAGRALVNFGHHLAKPLQIIDTPSYRSGQVIVMPMQECAFVDGTFVDEGSCPGESSMTHASSIARALGHRAVLCAALVLVASGGINVAHGATTSIPGTLGRGNVTYGATAEMHGNFVVWQGGVTAPARVTCPADASGVAHELPAPQQFVDVREPRDVRVLPASVELGVVVIDDLDQVLDGQASGTRYRCDGSHVLVRIDLHDASAADVFTRARFDEFTDETTLVRGELVRSIGVADFPHDSGAYDVTRVDLTTGATQTGRMPVRIYRPLDTPTLDRTPLARSRSGDLFWEVGYRTIPDTIKYAYDPCGGPARMRVWSGATGKVEVFAPRMRIKTTVSRDIVNRVVRTCWGAFDPDTRTMYAARPAWSAEPAEGGCRGFGFQLRSVCGPHSAAYPGPRRCCIRVRDYVTGEHLVLPPASAGPFQEPIGVGETALVWEVTKTYRGQGAVGEIHVTPLVDLQPVLEVRSVQRRGSTIVVTYRSHGLRKLVNVVRQRSPTEEGLHATVRRLCSWTQPGSRASLPATCSWDYLVGFGGPSARGCKGPFTFARRVPVEDLYNACLRNAQSDGVIAFPDEPGVQTYRLTEYGFLSRAIEL